MLIYEKNNKLNINFENKMDDPDLSLFKEDDKVKISANGSTSEAGQGSGSSGGANVLTLYASAENTGTEGVYDAYKDSEHTQQYESFEEAKEAVEFADIIKVVLPSVEIFGVPTQETRFAAAYQIGQSDTMASVIVAAFGAGDQALYILFMTRQGTLN